MKATGSLLCFLCCAATASAARTTAGGLVHDLPTANTATSSNTGLAWQLHAHTNTHASSKAGLTTNPDCSHVTCSIKKHTCAKFNRNAQAWSPQPGAAFQWNGNHNSPFASGQALTHNFDSDECDGTAHYSVVVNHHNSESVCTAASGGHHCGMGVLTGGSACECKPGKVNGAWGAWGTFSSCVNGKRTRTRECNNPAPRDGGSLCVGDPLEEDTEGCKDSGRCYKITKRAYKNNGHLRVTYAYLNEAGLTQSDFSTKCYTSSAADRSFGGTNTCASKHGLQTYWWTYVSPTNGQTYPGVPGSCCNGNQQLKVSTVPDAMCDGDYEMADVEENKFAADSSAVLPGGDIGDVSSCQECANKCAKVPRASVFIIDGNPANAPGVSGAGTCATLATTPGTCHCYGAARYNQLQADAKHVTGRVLTYMTTLGCQGTGAAQPNPCPSGTW